MAINIHFFSKQKQFNYDDLFEYFDSLPNFTVYYTNDLVELVYKDEDFNFKYRYLITRQSRVTRICDLNPEYINLNFLLEMPVLIPSFLAKEIIAGAQKICKQFGFEIFHDSFEDIKPFNFVDVLNLFETMRAQYVDNYGLQGKILYDVKKMDVVFKYQRCIEKIKEGVKTGVVVNNCFPIVNHVNNTTGMAYKFRLGDATVIPPYVDYIYIDGEEQCYLLTKEVFDKLYAKHFTSIEAYLPDLFYIKPRFAKKIKNDVKRIQKVSIDSSNFVPLALSDVIEA